MEGSSSSQEEDTRVPTDQRASAARPRNPVRLKQGAPEKTVVLLNSRGLSNTRVLRTEASSRTSVAASAASSRTPMASSFASSRTLMSLREAPSRTPVALSAASSRTPMLAQSRTLLPLRETPSKNPMPPSAASSRTLVSSSTASSSTPLLSSESSSSTEMPLKAALSSTQVSWDPQGFWAVDANGELRPQELGIVARAEDSSTAFTSYFRFISDFLKPEIPAQAVKGLIEMTVELLKLDHQVKETQIQQKLFREEAELLLSERLLPFQAETEVMLANLTHKTRQYRRAMENEWNNYAEESAQALQEFAAKSVQHTSDLPRAQLLEKKKLEASLKQQLEAGRGRSLEREKQCRELQVLQEELRKAQVQTAAVAHARYLQEKALLEKQLNELALSMLGKEEEKRLKRKAQSVEVATQRCASELHRLLAEYQELHKQFMPQPLQAQCQEEKSPRSWLKIQKQQLQPEKFTKCRLPEARTTSRSAKEQKNVFRRFRTNPQ